MIKTKKGLDLPISGAPRQEITAARPVRSVAVLGTDFPGMKPTMAVAEGDTVKLGEVLFTDKKNAGVQFTAPAAGKIAAIHRGEKRALKSVVIDVDDDGPAVTFESQDVAALSKESATQLLVESGLWTALRTRPFGKIPQIGSIPNSIFITAMDSRPLAADPAVVIAEHAADFESGQRVLETFPVKGVFVCHEASASVPVARDDRIRAEAFSGPHPAGLPGTHIHFLDPVSADKTVWYINYQDVIAIGKLFSTGTLWTERVIALGGPMVAEPVLLRTRLGASTDELTAGALSEGDARVISGCVFSGHTARSALAFLGRYDLQISVIAEDSSRNFIGYLTPGANRHSVLPIYLSRLTGKLLDFTTTTHGSPRAMVPVGNYERVMPMDMLPTQLLRAVLVGDIETAINLGVLELEEDDVSLCTYACPGKYEYGPVLRNMLTTIEKEG